MPGQDDGISWYYSYGPTPGEAKYNGKIVPGWVRMIVLVGIIYWAILGGAKYSTRYYFFLGRAAWALPARAGIFQAGPVVLGIIFFGAAPGPGFGQVFIITN